MTAPTCLCGCGRRVRPRTHRQRVPNLGLRVVDGVSWNWFRSRRCSGRHRGRSNIATGAFRVAVEHARLARYEAADKRLAADVADEARTLTALGVPKPVALATLTRLVLRTRRQLRDRLYHEWFRKPRRKAAAA